MQLSEAKSNVKFHCLVQKSYKNETCTLVPYKSVITCKVIVLCADCMPSYPHKFCYQKRFDFQSSNCTYSFHRYCYISESIHLYPEHTCLHLHIYMLKSQVIFLLSTGKFTDLCVFSPITNELMVFVFVQFVFTTYNNKENMLPMTQSLVGHAYHWLLKPMDAGELKPEYISLALPHA